MPPGAKSVIVFVSIGGKEYAATAGTRHPKADQRFRIGSVTKTFTATIVLQLVQEGKLRLDSTLEEHLPGVVPRGGEITIRHLLSHRSGLANVTDYPQWLSEAERSPSTSPINSLRFAASKPLAFRPGSRERYSNTNYIALGLVIEKVTGRSYAEELEHAFRLPRTRAIPISIPALDEARGELARACGEQVEARALLGAARDAFARDGRWLDADRVEARIAALG
jgi:hypothetical protein